MFLRLENVYYITAQWSILCHPRECLYHSPLSSPSLPPPQYPTEGFLVSTLPILWKFQLSCTLSTGILGLTSDDSQLEREMSRQSCLGKCRGFIKDQTTWFGHLQKKFCYEEVQFKLFCLPVKTNCPPC